MKKNHILLVENNDNEIEFFSDALEKSGLSFLCATAKNFEQAFKILKNIIPEIIFVNIGFAKTEGCEAIKKLRTFQSTPVILYSHASGKKIPVINNAPDLNYVQLPDSAYIMAKMLNNLFIDSEVYN